MSTTATTPVGVGLELLLRAALDALLTNLAVPVVQSVIAPGAVVPADACCVYEDEEVLANGQAHARLGGVWPTKVFPQPDQAWSRYPSELAVQIELGVYRCVAGLGENGEPPPADEVTADALRALDDLAAMRVTALTVFGKTPVVLGADAPLGPSGYCAGRTLLFTTLFNPACPPAEPVEEP